MSVDIQEGVPIPAAHSGKGEVGAALRALAKAKIGDSVLLTPDMSSGNPSKFSVNIATRAGAILGAGKYACRKEGNGMRIWKTA